MKLLLVYDQKEESMWRDGFWAAIKLLEKEHSVEWCNVLQTVPKRSDYDFTIVRGDWGGISDQVGRSVPGKKGLYICGNAQVPKDAADYDVLFFETPWQEMQINSHPHRVHCFGVNSAIFQKRENIVPFIDILGVGALALWKRWDKMIGLSGVRLVIGEYQLGNERESLDIARNLLSHGVGVMPSVEPEALCDLYNSARLVYIPANFYGGGERSVLEARMCGRDVWVESDNAKLNWLLDQPLWDQHYMRDQILKGISEVL